MKFSTGLAPRGCSPWSFRCRRRPRQGVVCDGAVAPGRSRQGATGRSAEADEPSAKSRGQHRAPAGPPPRRRCRWGRSDRSAAARARCSAGSRAARRSARGRRRTARRRRRSSASARAATAPRRADAGPPRSAASRSPPARPTLGAAAGGSARTTRRAPAGSCREPRGHDVAQPPAHAVAYHRVADGLAHHETGPRCRRTPGSDGRDGRRAATGRCDGHAAASTAKSSRRVSRAPAGSTRAACIRRRACRAPCCDAQRGSRARHGCACAAGSRAYAPGGGCSAGKCACPCSRSALLVDGVGTAPGRRSLSEDGSGRAVRRAAARRHAETCRSRGAATCKRTQRRQRGSNRPRAPGGPFDDEDQAPRRPCGNGVLLRSLLTVRSGGSGNTAPTHMFVGPQAPTDRSAYRSTHRCA